ncbi:unnamed protein product [Diatraea saccharalis]|uniref:Zinc finger PHD-type domain-containing protein n=1 Tax=Diatraea saccharalis TaxID=40085 RepID=A0A9N9QTY5_9NEOP|nr:unnamed protein product [Diatraea saccharalis]
MSCHGCLKSIKGEKSIICTSPNCGKKFHTFCATSVHLTQEQTKKWICPECIAQAKKGGDNTHTPIRAAENVTMRKKTNNSASFPLSIPGNDVIDVRPDLDDSMRALLVEFGNLRQDMAKFQADIVSKVNEMTAKISSYDSIIKQFEDKEKENIALKLQISQLQEQVNKRSEEALRSDLEILGLFETPNENPIHLVLNTAIKIGVKLEDYDIDYASRAGPRNKKDSKEGKQLPRPLIVSFTRKIKRAEFLKQAKSRRTLESREIIGEGPERKIYVNERLTAEKRWLFRTS